MWLPCGRARAFETLSLSFVEDVAYASASCGHDNGREQTLNLVSFSTFACGRSCFSCRSKSRPGGICRLGCRRLPLRDELQWRRLSCKPRRERQESISGNSLAG